jgi:hypothetical protein
MQESTALPHWSHRRCTPDSCRLAAAPTWAASGQKETCLHGFSAKNRSLKTASLRLRLSHDDSIADFKGHQVFTNLQRTVIGFARSRHEVINGCRWHRSAAKKDQPLRTPLSGRVRDTPRQYSYCALVRNRPMPQHPKLRSELKA